MAYKVTVLKRVFLGLSISAIVIALFTIQIHHKLKLAAVRNPSFFPCHNTNLRPSYYGYQHSQPCRPRTMKTSSCQYANERYGSPKESLDVRTCPKRPIKDICTFKKAKTLVLSCNKTYCGSSKISMGKTDLEYGYVRQWTTFLPFTTHKAVEFVKKTLKQGDTFCFIKCGSIVQALVFPPHLYMNRKVNKSTSKVNINIVLLDSISRVHFYRMLRQSINALRNIMDNGKATVLDFEIFQSIGTHTFENIRALFSGVVEDRRQVNDMSAVSSDIGMRVLYKHFKSRGYHTVFQEDLCWYDRWGTVLDNIKMKGSSKPTPKRWSQFKKIISKHHIDSFGLTFFSCQVLRLYNETNHYESPAKVCLNGRFFSSYFLRYLEDVTRTVRVRNSRNAPPYVSYSHFNTGHTHSGTRIRNMDQGLAHFISALGRDPWTWTIVMSDHGHKVTNYALNTVDGPYEATNPLLFMVIPNNVAKVIGKSGMSALEQNQHRLITALDIHHTLMTFLDNHKSGLMENSTANRTCSDVPIMPLAKCQCYENEAKYGDNSPQFLWMAEFAVGQLNNRIQNQFSNGAPSEENTKCKRLIGRSFKNIIQTGSHTTFDLHVSSRYARISQDEVFKVAIDMSSKRATLQSFERVTMYNKFKNCVDKSVDIKLCICDRASQKATNTLHQSIRTPMFNSSSAKIKNLYKECLLKLTRSYLGVTFAIEVFNNCKNRTFIIDVGGYTEQVFLSASLPFTAKVKPFTSQFLYSATTQAANYDMDIGVKAKQLK